MGLVVTLLLVGFALLLLETVVPGIVLGIIGVGCLIAGVVIAYVRFGLNTGNIALTIVATGLVAGTCLWIKYFPGSAVARVFVSKGQIGVVGAEKPELLHQTGSAITDLRPSGTAFIQGRRVDVVSEGSFVQKGAPVKVVAIEGLRVVVRPVV